MSAALCSSCCSTSSINCRFLVVDKLYPPPPPPPPFLIPATTTTQSSNFSSNPNRRRPILCVRAVSRELQGGSDEKKKKKKLGDDEEDERNSMMRRRVIEAERLVDKINFGELCNEFECISSPAVESTARQLVRDILELRQRNRALGTYSFSVKYKDPVRTFTGREKYKRPIWATGALEKPSVTVQDMAMLSTSILNIKWTLKGTPKLIIAAIGGDLIIRINSKFVLNQISGQVIEHEEIWDVSTSSTIGQAYFWASKRLNALVESGRDVVDTASELPSRFSSEEENMEVYPDPTGDPTKFFQRDDSFENDVYQIALFLAVLYFVVQFLKITL